MADLRRSVDCSAWNWRNDESPISDENGGTSPAQVALVSDPNTDTDEGDEIRSRHSFSSVQTSSLLVEQVGLGIGAAMRGSVGSSFDTLDSSADDPPAPHRPTSQPETPPLGSICTLVAIAVLLVAAAMSQATHPFATSHERAHWGQPITSRGSWLPQRNVEGPPVNSSNSVASVPPVVAVDGTERHWRTFLAHHDASADQEKDKQVQIATAGADDEALAWLQSLRFDDKTSNEAYAAAESYFNETIREPLRIGILGQSGVGKSTLTNTMRGLPPSSRGAAPVSPTQMTGVRAPYQPDGYPALFHPGVIYYDLPGCGTSAVPACGPDYYNAFDLDRFDVFILLTQRRVDTAVVCLYDELVGKSAPGMRCLGGTIDGSHSSGETAPAMTRGSTRAVSAALSHTKSGSSNSPGLLHRRRRARPVFVVRTKVDVDVSQELEDYGRPPSETLAALRSELHVEFGLAPPKSVNAHPSSQKRDQRPPGSSLASPRRGMTAPPAPSHHPTRVYLVSARLRDAGKWELPDLQRDIAASLGEAKRAKFSLSLDNYSDGMIQQRVAAAKEVVRAHALLATANSVANPVPFLSSTVNFGIVLSMNHEISRCFGISPGQVEAWVSALTDSANTGLVEALRIASNFAGKFLAAEAVNVAVASCASGGVGCSVLVGEAVKFIPLVGSLAGGGATFASVRWIGGSVTEAAVAASSEIYAILKQHRLQPEYAATGSREHIGTDVGALVRSA